MLPIRMSPRNLMVFAILFWAMMVVTGLLGHPLTTAAMIHAVIRMVQGLGALALARSMMLAGMLVERERLTQVWDVKLVSNAMVHGLGGLAALLIVPAVSILSATFA